MLLKLLAVRQSLCMPRHLKALSNVVWILCTQSARARARRASAPSTSQCGRWFELVWSRGEKKKGNC
jgi:hypothetical protein